MKDATAFMEVTVHQFYNEIEGWLTDSKLKVNGCPDFPRKIALDCLVLGGPEKYGVAKKMWRSAYENVRHLLTDEAFADFASVGLTVWIAEQGLDGTLTEFIMDYVAYLVEKDLEVEIKGNTTSKKSMGVRIRGKTPEIANLVYQKMMDGALKLVGSIDEVFANLLNTIILAR
ncbi:MAG: hypothetical protein AB1401_00590 [Thermodesulfobacteriota bacterium]